MNKPKRSKVLDKIRAGETANCCKLNLACSRAIEIAALDTLGGSPSAESI